MAVFDVKGQLIFSGHPMDDKAEKIIKTALKDATVRGSEEKSTSGLGAKKANLVEERSWTNTDGKSIKATLISLQDNTGKFTFPDGRSFDYDITKLSDADQTLIKEAVEAAAKTEDAEEE